MTPPNFHDFFLAAATVAGALIGLLFVALSVGQSRMTEERSGQSYRVRASAALTSFLNSLTLSLFALIPGIGLRWPAFAVGVTGLLSLAGPALSLVRVHGLRSVPPADVIFLVGLAVVFGFQIDFAIRLIARAGDTGAARGLAILVIVCFSIGIARAWELVGGPSITFSGEVVSALRGKDEDGNE
jgi:hypothetical protein